MNLDVRPDLGLIEGYHSAQVDVEVRLNTNESPEPPPREFIADLAAAVSSASLHRYPDRRATALREALARHHNVAPDQIFAANGSNEVLQSLLLAYGGPGRRALVFEPTYALHSHIAKVTGTAVDAEQRDDTFCIDPRRGAAAVAKAGAAIVFLCSPNNPTGGVDGPEVLDAIVEVAPGLVVVDEAYGQFSSWSAVGRVHNEGRIVVVRTFSKTWALAGLRLGYAIAPARVVAALDTVALPYHLDAVKQAAGVLALHHEAAMAARVARIVEQRGRLSAALGALDVEVWPSQANFILFRPTRVGGAEVWRRLVQKSVLVRDCSTWPGLDGCLRVTVGTASENDRFLTALTEALA